MNKQKRNPRLAEYLGASPRQRNRLVRAGFDPAAYELTPEAVAVLEHYQALRDAAPAGLIRELHHSAYVIVLRRLLDGPQFMQRLIREVSSEQQRERGAKGGNPGKTLQRAAIEHEWHRWTKQIDLYPSLEKFAVEWAEKFSVKPATVRAWCLKFAEGGMVTKPWLKRHAGKLTAARWLALLPPQ